MEASVRRRGADPGHSPARPIPRRCKLARPVETRPRASHLIACAGDIGRDHFPPMSLPILRAQDLTKTVRSGDEPLTILDGVSFHVDPGATVAIVGASGSGKTTLLGLLAGLDQPTSGEVWLDGSALSGVS